jgi:hypothetical protein
MLSPDELIGQKVWLKVDRDPNYPHLEPCRVQAEITQPTSPPWFFARYQNPPQRLQSLGQWLTLYEAQYAVLTDPVIDYDFDDEEDFDEMSKDKFERL